MLQLDKETILLNKIAQSLATIEAGVLLYDELKKAQKKNLYLALEFCLSQSKPSKKHLQKGMELANTDYPTFTIKEQSDQLFNTIFDPRNELEYREAFIIMLFIFRESDSNIRHTRCKNGCYHPWHNLT